MDTLLFIIILIMSAIIYLLMYKVYDLTSKVSRLQKRYNSLLRGRGELNIEDLIRAHSKDLKDTDSKLNEISAITDKLFRDYGSTANNINERISSEINEVKDEFNMLVENLNDKYENDINSLDDRLKNIIESNHSSINESIENIENSFTRNINLINEQLSFAIQKIGFYKYDAFNNQTGELSFTIVLLDKYANGVMITSINGREDNYNYSKSINNGKAEFEISPEEQIALDRALGKKGGVE